MCGYGLGRIRSHEITRKRLKYVKIAVGMQVRVASVSSPSRKSSSGKHATRHGASHSHWKYCSFHHKIINFSGGNRSADELGFRQRRQPIVVAFDWHFEIHFGVAEPVVAGKTMSVSFGMALLPQLQQQYSFLILEKLAFSSLFLWSLPLPCSTLTSSSFSCLSFAK